MKVKRYQLRGKKNFTLVIPVDKEIDDLSEEVQAFIKENGSIGPSKTVELNPSNKLDNETIAGVTKDGVYFWKTSVEFEESVGRDVDAAIFGNRK